MKPSPFQKRKGYYISNNQITFILAENLYKEQLSSIQVTKVAVQGSFTSWKKSWPLTKTDSQLWKLETSINQIKIPSNSGQPEFRFIINDQYKLSAAPDLSLKYKFYDGHHEGYKNVILLPNDNPDKIKRINNFLNSYKTNYKSKQELANFRAVPLGQAEKNTLYRSYHPFIKSKPGHPREEERIKAVQQLIKNNNINSIINLADKKEKIPDLLTKYQQLINQQNIIFINQDHDYDIYYYSTNSEEFAQLMHQVVSFILNNQPPFLIHCRIGTDRTGVISAILAALMGSSWPEIVRDYKQSNQTGIKEYRDEKLLQYAFEQLLPQPFNPQTLNQAVTSYFKDELKLTSKQIKALKIKLKQKNRLSAT